MREITFDLTADSYLPQSGFGGFEGEHNATRLSLLLPARLIEEGAVYYMIFEVMKHSELVFSAPLEAENGIISASLPRQVMLSPEIRVYAAAYRREGEELTQIAKSARVILEIRNPEEGSVVEASSKGGEIPGLVIESRVISDSKNPVSSFAIHEEFTGLKQREIVSAYVDTAGELILQKRDDSVLNVGYVVGPQGVQGPQGEQGSQGEQGPKGERGEVDYSLVAGALKGMESGYAVALNDVSPLEHEMGVKVKSKNLLEVAIKENTEGTATQQWQCTAAVEKDGKITLTNTHTSGVALARVGTVDLKKAVTYTLSQRDAINIKKVLLFRADTTETVVVAGASLTTFTLPEDVTVDVAVYMDDISTTGNTAMLYVQLEEGASATDYAPCVPDLTTVTLKRYGKNLFHATTDLNNGYHTIENGTIVYTSAERSGYEEYIGLNISGTWDHINATNKKVTLSFDLKTEKEGQIRVYTLGKKALDFGGTIYVNATTEWKRFSVTGTTYYDAGSTNSTGCMFSFIGSYYGSGIIPYVKNVQIEIGETETDYEPYKEAVSYTPNVDGNVTGIIGNGESMTLFTDAEGVTVEADYNKDMNKVIESLVNAIISLGGNV